MGLLVATLILSLTTNQSQGKTISTAEAAKICLSGRATPIELSEQEGTARWFDCGDGQIVTSRGLLIPELES